MYSIDKIKKDFPKCNFDWINDDTVVELITILKNADISFKFVGGIVRDSLIGKETKDIDIAAKAKPDVIKKLVDPFYPLNDKGQEFGTISVYKNGYSFEITTLREDIKTDGRKAVVSFGVSYMKDSKRRDFSINALYLSPDLTLYDYHNGVTDLKSKSIKFIGDAQTRIKEDYLRIIRYFRFKATYGIEFDESNIEEKEYLKIISKEKSNLEILSFDRIMSEMQKIFNLNECVNILFVMQETGVFDYITSGLLIDIGMLKMAIGNNIQMDWKMKIAVLLYKNKEVGVMWPNAVKSMINFYHQHIKSDVVDVLCKGVGARISINFFLLLRALKSDDFGINYKMYNKYLNLLTDFPVTGKELILKGVKVGPKIGDVLFEMKHKWIKADGKTSKSELMQVLNGER